MISLRIPWKLSTILKTSNKSVWSNLFQYVKVYIFWKFIQYTIHSDETEILKKNSSGHNKLYEKCIHPCNASFRKLHLINFTFNLQFLQELKHMAHISKNVCWIFQFRFHLIFIKFYIFVQQKTWTLWL